MEYCPEGKQRNTPKDCPGPGDTPRDDCRSGEKPAADLRERTGHGSDGLLPLIFPHKCLFSVIIEPSSGLSPELGAGVQSG